MRIAEPSGRRRTCRQSREPFRAVPKLTADGRAVRWQLAELEASLMGIADSWAELAPGCPLAELIAPDYFTVPTHAPVVGSPTAARSTRTTSPESITPLQLASPFG